MQYDDVTTNPIWRTAAILKIVFGYISTSYCPINSKFCMKRQNQFRHRPHDQNTKFWKFKMADGRHFENVFFRYNSAEDHPYWKSFLAISQRIIVQLTRNLIRSSRITFRYRSHDQNTKIWKFKMADDRHFEIGFITISQLRISSNFNEIWCAAA